VGSVSAVHATPIRQPQPRQRPRQHTRPRLLVVPTPVQARTRAPFVALCMLMLATALIGTLLLNTAMAQIEYQRQSLRSELAQSVQARQRLASELERAASPEQLTAAAEALGMVRSGSIGYLRLADGAILVDPRSTR
jgi:hypothetical protein